MNRILTVVNMIGVLALAGMCIFQWKENSRITAETGELDRTRQQQAVKLAEQEKIIAGDTQDLNDFRQRLEKAEARNKDNDARLAAAMAQNKQFEAERAQYKTTLEKWMAAVSERDNALKQSAERVQQLSSERNAAANKFNDLVNQYNSVVKDLNAQTKGH